MLEFVVELFERGHLFPVFGVVSEQAMVHGDRVLAHFLLQLVLVLLQLVPKFIDHLTPVSYTHLRAHETVLDLVCRLLLEKKQYTHSNMTY